MKDKIEFKLPDGSMYKVTDKKWEQALDYKLKAEGLDIKKDSNQIQDVFIKKIKKHWNGKTVPTKFPWDISWKEYFQQQKQDYEKGYAKKSVTKFKDMAELADVVMYQIIRASLMGLILSEMTKHRKKKSKVIALGNNNEAIIYSDKKPINKKIEDVFWD